MARVKRGFVSRNKHKKVLKATKGFYGSASKLYRIANAALTHALMHAFADRRKKKGDFRGLWIARINGALEQYKMSYSVFMGQLKKKGVIINRKMLSELAITKPQVFKDIIDQTTK
jgi:large subunit ribosomal protein L20